MQDKKETTHTEKQIENKTIRSSEKTLNQNYIPCPLVLCVPLAYPQKRTRNKIKKNKPK